jgi:hypothetical protein
VAGTVDPTGFIDITSAVLYAIDGDIENTLISAGSILPGGDLLKASRIATKGAAKGGGTAFDIAKAGGKHAGFFKNYVGRSPAEINKSINSLQAGNRGINVHLDKIANPSKYVTNWNSLNPAHQQSLIRGWQKEITNATEQIQILRGILGQ